MLVHELAHIKDVNNVFPNQFRSHRKKLYGDMWRFFACFSVLNQVSAASVVQQNAATLFYCEAPEMFCGLPHFTRFIYNWLFWWHSVDSSDCSFCVQIRKKKWDFHYDLCDSLSHCQSLSSLSRCWSLVSLPPLIFSVTQTNNHQTF